MPHRLPFRPPSQSLPSDCCVVGRGARSRASRTQGGWGWEDRVEPLIRSHQPDITHCYRANGPKVQRKSSFSLPCAQDQSRRVTAWASHAPRRGVLSWRYQSGRIRVYYWVNHGAHWAGSSSSEAGLRSEAGLVKTKVAGVASETSYTPQRFSSLPRRTSGQFQSFLLLSPLYGD